MRHMRFDTIAVHGIYDAQAALANQGSIIEPLFLSPAPALRSRRGATLQTAWRCPRPSGSRGADVAPDGTRAAEPPRSASHLETSAAGKGSAKK